MTCYYCWEDGEVIFPASECMIYGLNETGAMDTYECVEPESPSDLLADLRDGTYHGRLLRVIKKGT